MVTVIDILNTLDHFIICSFEMNQQDIQNDYSFTILELLEKM